MQVLRLHHTSEVLLERVGEGILLARGNTVPSDAQTGYAVNCLYIDANGAAGSQLYVNEGTLASCNFNLLGSGSQAVTTTLAEGVNIATGTTTGSKIGESVSQKIGFWNATPVIQQAAALQGALTNSTGGSQDGTLAAVGATNGSDVSSAINNNFTDIYALLTAIRTALVNTGIIKGSA